MPVDDQILYPSLRLAGVVGAAGRGASPSQKADAFGALNRMIESLSNQRLIIYTIAASRYRLSPSKTFYTIGPGGDFNAPRPIRLQAANIVLTGGSAEVHVPLEILSDKEWAATRVREIPTTIPSELYNDGGFPLSRLYLRGYPTVANDLELYAWSPLTKFAAQTDPVAFPPGYEDALVHQLAVRLCALFRTQCTPELRELAYETFAVIKAGNAASPAIASADYGAQGRRSDGFNYYSGGPR